MFVPCHSPRGGLTVCVSGGGAGVDSFESRKTRSQKMPENAAESPPSTARFVRAQFCL